MSAIIGEFRNFELLFHYHHFREIHDIQPFEESLKNGLVFDLCRQRLIQAQLTPRLALLSSAETPWEKIFE